MQAKIFVVAAFVLTFAVGVLTGALIVRNFGHPEPPPWTKMDKHHLERHEPVRIEILKSRLNLNETQSQQIAAIIAKHDKQLRQHFGQIRFSSRQIFKQMTVEIDSVLTPEQRQKFHAAFPLPIWKAPHRSRRAPEDSLEARF